MIATLADLRALVRPLVEPRAWVALALRRIDQDPLAGRISLAERVRLAHAARDAGEALALSVRRDERGAAIDVLHRRGVSVEIDDSAPIAGPFVHHALYTAPPARVTLYGRAITALDRLLDGGQLRPILGAVSVQEVVLAHELCHHLVAMGQTPAAVRPTVEVMRVGRWRRRASLGSAEEVAAGGFAAAWCDLAWPPELLDCLSLVAWQEREGVAMLRALRTASGMPSPPSRDGAPAEGQGNVAHG